VQGEEDVVGQLEDQGLAAAAEALNGAALAGVGELPGAQRPGPALVDDVQAPQGAALPVRQPTGPTAWPSQDSFHSEVAGPAPDRIPRSSHPNPADHRGQRTGG